MTPQDQEEHSAVVSKMETVGSHGIYRGRWDLLDEMPDGWCIDKNAGSPLAGYEFITNGRSTLNGQERALLRVKPRQAQIAYQFAPAAIPTSGPAPKHETPVEYPRTINELARAKFKQSLLNDILVDLCICEIEGWSKTEYINEIRRLVVGLGKSVCVDAESAP